MSYDAPSSSSREYRGSDRGSSSRGYDDRDDRDRRGGGGYGGGGGSSSSSYDRPRSSSYAGGGGGGGGGGGYGPPRPAGRRLYVAGTGNATTEDIEDLFGKYGRVVDIALKAGFCFVEFQDDRDAADAVRGRDGYDWRGARLRVEHCKPRGERDVQFGLAPAGRAPGGYDRGFPSDRPPPKCYNCGQEGHLARDCKAGDWSNRCYFCKEEGHRTPQCPAKAAQFGGAAKPADSTAAGSSAPREERNRSRSRSPRRSSRSRSRSRSRGRENGQNGEASSSNDAAPAADQQAPQEA